MVYFISLRKKQEQSILDNDIRRHVLFYDPDNDSYNTSLREPKGGYRITAPTLDYFLPYRVFNDVEHGIFGGDLYLALPCKTVPMLELV